MLASQPGAELLLLGSRYVGLAEGLIDPTSADAVSERCEGERGTDLAEAICYEDRSAVAVIAESRNANHQRGSVLARARE